MTEETKPEQPHDVPIEIFHGGDSVLPPEGDRRKDPTSRAFKAIYSELKEGKARMDSQDQAIKENTDLTQQIKKDTSEIIDAFASVKGAFKVLNWIGSLAKPVTYAVMLGSALYGLFATIKGGSPPPHHPVK